MLKFITKKAFKIFVTKFEECIIHIGTDKTGTSALQSFFAINRLNLFKNDIFYPKTFGERSHYHLATALSNFNKKDFRRKELEFHQPKLIEEFRKKIIDSFRKEIENETCTKLLISSEALYVRMNTKEEVQRLKNFLDEFVNKYKIIVYFRPQHEHQISGFSTRCLSGKTDTEIFPKIRLRSLSSILKTSAYLEYDKALSIWSEFFNEENIFPKIFSRKELTDGDIKKDFISFLELNWNDFEDIEDKNISISADAQRFLLGINKHLPFFIGNKKNPYRGNLNNLISNKFNGTGLLPSRKECEDFFNSFSKSNEEVRRKWFPDRKELFEVDFTKYPEKAQEYPEIDHSAFEIFAELWTHNQKVNLVNDYILKGQMCIINEQYENALSHLEEALKIRPNHTMILQSLAYVLIKLQRFKDSEKYLNKAIMLEPNNPQLRKLQEKLETNKNG